MSIDVLNINSVDSYAKQIVNSAIAFCPKLISATAILVVGFFITKLLNRGAKRIMQARDVDATLMKFLGNVLFWALRFLLIVTVINELGVGTTSLVAILGAAGLAVGLSLQGSLSNFSGGILLILFKPFRVGDIIEAQGQNGTVKDIQIFTTKLLSANNQTIFIPNGVLSNGTIINHSTEGIRRADIGIAISYDTDIKKAKDIILGILINNPKVLQTPEAAVVVRDLNDSAIILSIRPWATVADFGSMTSDILENAKIAFDQAGINIQPYVKETTHQSTTAPKNI